MIYDIKYEDMIGENQRGKKGGSLFDALLMGIGAGLSTVSELLPYFYILKQLSSTTQLPAPQQKFTGVMPLMPNIPSSNYAGTFTLPNLQPYSGITNLYPSSHYGIAPIILELLKRYGG